MANDIFTVSTVFETKGQAESEKALRDNEAATKRYEQATRQLSSRMKVSVDRTNAKAKTLGQLDSATKRAENEIKRLSTSVEQGAITGGQYQGRLNQIAAQLRRMGLEDAQSRVMSYGRATREATTVVRQHEAAQKALQPALNNTRARTQALTTATNSSNTAQQRARQQLLATANSIAVLDGPLGGIASRFSAFGVLIGRIGIPLAALSIGLATFTFTAQRAIREFAEWEVTLATIENRLNSVGNQINVTSQELVRLSENIALNTLADEREVMRAASSLLTFRNITTDVFEDVLRSAQDLAASGFGTLESETLRLAKALEDPRQSLQSLSRAGVVFTRQQRQMIISLIDTGREAEAMGLILNNVEQQVGGAGLAQANNTLAGSLDTIGQAFRTLTRNLGEALSTTGPISVAIRTLEGAAQQYIEFTQELSKTEKLEKAIRRFDQFDDSLSGVQEGIRVSSEVIDQFGLAVESLTQRQMGRDLDLGKEVIQETVDALKEQVNLLQAQKDLRASIAQLDRRAESLDNLRSEIDLQRELVGLTQEQERVMRAMAAQGLGGDVWGNINRQVKEYKESLKLAGVESGIINRLVSDMRDRLQGVRDIAEEYAQVFEDQRIAREINRIEESTQSTNESLRRQVEILEEARAAGNDALTVTEARRQADLLIQQQMIETRIKIIEAADATELLKLGFEDAADAAAEVARLSGIISSLQEGADLQLRLGELGRTGRGGGGGAGTDPNAEFQRELDSLTQYLERRREEMMIARGFEREIIIEQYEERFETIRDGLERGLLTQQEFADKEIELAQSKADRIAEIERNLNATRLSDMAGFYGTMANIAQAGGDRMVKVVAAFSGIQATINAWNAYTAALASPTPMTPWARLSYAGAVLGAGLNAVRNIAQAGGGGGGGAAARTADAPREMREVSPQRVLIQGLNPDDLFTGQMLENLFESLYDENDNRGRVFVVAR